MSEPCLKHSGLETSIVNLEKDVETNKKDIKEVDKRVDRIISRMNITLGSAVASFLLLLLNFVFKGN